jgi:hypothetical protein
VGYSQNDSHAYYHDDPIEEISKTKSRFKFLTTGAIILGSIFYFQSTLAGNISLSSGTGIEFGQGFSQAVACSGNTDLTLTPRSTFINGSPGAHYLNSVTVSGIPDSCFGVDFTINAYGNTDNSPLALFNSISTNAVVYNNAGTFSTGIGSTGMTVASSTGTFTATFTTPVAQSSSVFKLTIQSGAHIRPLVVGNTGPGGGLIYYVNEAGFSCGATYASTGSPTGGLCHYLEVAPSGWNTGSDPGLIWANSNTDLSISNDASAYNNPLGVGLGYQNSITIVDAGNNTTTAAGAARAYAGGSKSDWYLPSAAELNLLCQWVRGVSPSVTTACTGGTLNSVAYGADSAGFGTEYYWSSSEVSASKVWWQYFSGGDPGPGDRNELLLVRPIRAF